MFQLNYCSHYLCVPLFILPTITTCPLFISHDYSLFCLHRLSKQHHLFVRSVKRRSSNHDYSLHTQRVFTQDWLNYYYLSPALFCLFIVLHKQFDELAWNKRSCSRFLEKSIATSLLFVHFVHIACCCAHLVVYLLFSYWCCCWFTYNNLCNNLVVVIGAAFNDRFNVKR